MIANVGAPELDPMDCALCGCILNCTHACDPWLVPNPSEDE